MMQKNFLPPISNNSMPTMAQSSNKSPSTNTGSTGTSRTKFDFTAHYSKKKKQAFNELDEYLKLHPEDFVSCCLFKWWLGRWAQFPNLYCLATDVLSISGNIYIPFAFSGPLAHCGVKFLGSAVAVEHIFLGGRDTISLHRASLNADTIHILMITKHHLHMTHDLLLTKNV